ncbi:MAG: DNA polymerase III subunit gamma/tau, partial [Hyphomicrobiales bacterium]|nr:DNA polymerase III subunit gamma/tau [Hyphomicrobiales bacterium]
AAEDVAVEPEALALIARVAEGSVRDALSLLDQAIAYGASGGVSTSVVHDMLGLSDRGEIVALFERAMKGEVAAALQTLRALYRAGADPADTLIAVAEFCHLVTRAKIAPEAPADLAVSEIERERANEFAEPLSFGALTRGWQILLKGVEDVRDSPRPLASAEMALIRLAYASDLPTPEEALRKLAGGSDGPPRHAPPLPPIGSPLRTSHGPAPADQARLKGAAMAQPANSAAPAPVVRLKRFEDVVALARTKRDIKLVQALEKDVRLERFEEGSIAFSLVDGASSDLAPTLAKRLQEWTGERWIVALAAGVTTPTLRETAEAREAERANGAAAHPLVRKVLERFKGARIVEVRAPESAAPLAPASAVPSDEDVAYTDVESDGDL